MIYSLQNLSKEELEQGRKEMVAAYAKARKAQPVTASLTTEKPRFKSAPKKADVRNL